ncbi:YbbR-like domain-containing protein [Aquiflexum lacus]|uniref:YbbR-like domain-containing protein n=1 Tax=Aquiflexum lacus TaxID=2483805 RepID=UPI001894537C|nr:YbbR-like domain-containing protein [Aquiflexum lacus]
MAQLKKFFNNLNPQKTSNFKVAALCFIAAATFWVLNALNKDNYTTVVDFPIEIIFDDNEFMAVENLPNRIKLEINGNGWDLLRKYFKINESPFLIEINNPSTKDYFLTSEIRRGLSETLNPTSLVSILPDTVRFSIDKIVTRKIKIQADTTTNTLAKNFRLITPIEIDPAVINIKGPTSVLQKLDGVLNVDLQEVRISENYSKIITLELPDSLKKYLELEEESVHVRFELIQMLEGNKRLRLKLVNFPDNVSLVQQPGTIIMSYLIDERKLEDLKALEFEAILNYNNRNAQDSTINVQVLPKPTYLENIKFEPEVLKLRYD